MKRKILWLLFAILPAVAIVGCGDSEGTSADDGDAAVESGTEAGEGTEAGANAEGAGILGDLISSADYSDVTLCDYKGLSAEKTVYPVTEEDIDTEVEYLLYDYVDYAEVDRPSQAGDYVEVYMTATADGETLYDYADEEYEIDLGYEEFGPEFDEKLTGVSAGDELSFSVTYDESYEDDEMAGKTVDYAVTVNSVTEEILPEMTEDFITGELGYESEEDMRAQLQASLEDDYDSDSEYEVREDLMQQVIDGSTFGSYTQELYDACRESVDESYLSSAWLFGVETAQEVYDMFGMTDEDIESEVLNQMYRMIVVNEISIQEGLTLTDEEYQAGLTRYAEEAEMTEDETLDEYGETSLRYWILEDKVLDLLEENATITEVTDTSWDEEIDEEIDEEGTEEEDEAVDEAEDTEE